MSVSWDRDITKLKVGDVATATVKLNGVPAPVATKCQWAMDVTGVVSIAQSTTTPGLNKLLATKAGAVRLIALAGGSYSPIMMASVAAVAPPPPHVPVMTMQPTQGDMTVGDVRVFSAYRDGALATDGIAWSSSSAALVKDVTPIGASWRVEAARIGLGVKVRATDTATGAFVEQTFAINAKPIPIPPSKAPAALWGRLRDYLYVCGTDFYYNWKLAAEAVCAMRYDLYFSGDSARHLRMKALNPLQRLLPYTLQYTSIVKGTASSESLATAFQTDCEQWCALNGVSPARAEAMWLHSPGTDASLASNRVVATIWGSKRHVLDPRNLDAQNYTISRYQRITAPSYIDGAFIDEFGSGGMITTYKLATGGDSAMMTALQTAETYLIGRLREAIPGKQLVLNTASYMAQWDFYLAQAALGVHMEQTNNPMSVDWWASTWTFIDRLLAQGLFVNFVPPYQWGEYESNYDGKGVPAAKLAPFTADDALAGLEVQAQRYANHPIRGPWARAEADRWKPTRLQRTVAQVRKAVRSLRAVPQGTHMDTPRGKLLELCGAYMVVTDPALLALSIENGDWGKYTPDQNWLFQINAAIGKPIEVRQKVVHPGQYDADKTHQGLHFQRRFTSGLVLVNPIWNRGQQDYGPNGATQIALPADRPYARVLPDGTLAAPSLTVTLRCPEAAIFVAV